MSKLQLLTEEDIVNRAEAERNRQIAMKELRAERISRWAVVIFVATSWGVFLIWIGWKLVHWAKALQG
jgi:hypothetical protein